jgi:hypothetical protein
MPDPGGLVSPAAKGNWRKIRGIGFRENPVIGHESKQVVIGPLAKGDDPAERHIPSRSDGRLGERVRARVAMHYASHTGGAGLRYHGKSIAFGIPRMNHDRHTGIRREFKLPGKCATLLRSRRVVIVVIESALPDGDRPVGKMLAQLFDIPRRVEPDRIVRMNPGGEPDKPRIAGGEIPRRASGAEDIPGAAA